MPLLLLLTVLSALARPLAAPGEVLGGAEVVRVLEHDEFQQVVVTLPDGRELTVEANVTGAPTGACGAHGLSLFPRWELLGESVAVADQPPVVQALCGRLEERGATLALAPPRGDGGRPPDEESPEVGPDGAPTVAQPAVEHGPPRRFSWKALHGALIALALAALAAMAGPGRRGLAALPVAARRDLGLVAAVGLLVRLVASPRGVFWGPYFGYGRLLEAWGGTDAHPLYGGGYGALFSPLSAALDHSPMAVFGGNLALSALAPPLLWALARMVGPGDRVGPLVSGLGLALLPVAVLLAGSEAMHVSLATLTLLSITAAVAFRQTGALSLALLSGLSLGFAAHIRPEVAPLALLPAAWVLAAPPRGGAAGTVAAAAILAVLVGHRALDLAFAEVGSAADYGAALTDPAFWFALVVPKGTEPGASRFTHTFLQLRLTPFLLPALAVVGVARGRRAVVALALAWWGLALAPVLAKSWPLADATRLQLPALAPALLLAGLGASALAARWRGPTWALPGAVALVSVAMLPLVLRPWAVHEARDHLLETAPSLPADAVVLYDDGTLHHAAFARWMTWHSGAEWVGIQAFRDGDGAASPLFAWRGVTCQLHPHQGERGDTVCGLLDACDLRPWKTAPISSRSDVNGWLPEPTEPVGLYAVDACRFNAGPQ